MPVDIITAWEEEYHRCVLEDHGNLAQLEALLDAAAVLIKEMREALRVSPEPEYIDKAVAVALLAEMRDGLYEIAERDHNKRLEHKGTGVGIALHVIEGL